MTQNVTFYPIGFTLENYANVFKQSNLGSSFIISVLRTLGGIVGTLIVTGLAAYAMSKKTMPGKRWLSLVLIIPMYISGGMIPTYIWMYQLKLVNNFWIFILLYFRPLGSPLGWTKDVERAASQTLATKAS